MGSKPISFHMNKIIKVYEDTKYLHDKIRNGKIEDVKKERPDLWERLQSGNKMFHSVMAAQKILILLVIVRVYLEHQF